MVNSLRGEFFTNVILDGDGLPARLPRSRERLRVQFYAALMLADAICIVLGFLFANVLRYDAPLAPAGLDTVALLVPIYVAIALNSHAFSQATLFDSRLGAKRALAALAVACGAILLVGFYQKTSADMSRAVFGAGATAGALMLLVARRGAGRMARRLFGTSAVTEVMIRDGVDAPIRPGCYLIDAQAAGLHPSDDDPALLHRLGLFLKNAERVLVACAPERREAWATALKGADVDGEVLLPELDHLGPLGVGNFLGLPTMLVSVGPLNLEERVLKRALDLGMLLVLAPMLVLLMGLVAIAVKLDSTGPVFFRQPRIGQGNRQFALLKFRSMRVEEADAGGRRSTLRDDDRITRVGRFIRRTSLDELPQVLNVLMGRMSIVGPRPHAVLSTAEDALFWEVDNRYWHRHAMKPGMTGLAQVRGFRGATRCREDLTNRLQADLEYLNGWTIWRDIAILFATTGVLTHKNAY